MEVGLAGFFKRDLFVAHTIEGRFAPTCGADGIREHDPARTQLADEICDTLLLRDGLLETSRTLMCWCPKARLATFADSKFSTTRPAHRPVVARYFFFGRYRSVMVPS